MFSMHQHVRQNNLAGFKLTLASLLLSAAMHTQAAPLELDIPSQSLDQALNALALKSGERISFSTDLTEKHTAPALKGKYELRRALEKLLEGSGLIIKDTGNNSFTVVGATDQQVSTLPEVLVQDIAQNESLTEGTQSYTTQSMSTATRLPLSIRETPQAVTVITRQRMDDQGMLNITDVVKSTPGVFLSNADGTGRPNFEARGFGVSNIMYDGSLVPWSSYIPSAQANLAMYDRVEVVRGATGLMQGAGNPSAAINLVRKRPTSEFKGSVTAYAGSWDNYGSILDLGGAMNEAASVRGRVVASVQDSGSFRDGQGYENHLLYGISEIDLADRTTLTVGAFTQKDSTNGSWWGGLPVNPDGSHVKLNRSVSLANNWEYLDQDNKSLFAILEHSFNQDWKLKLSTTYMWNHTDGLGTFMRSTITGGTVSRDLMAWRGDQENKASSYDLVVNGKYELFGRQHELAFGANRNQFDASPHNYRTTYIGANTDIYNWSGSTLAKPVLPYTSTGHTRTRQDGVYVTSRLNLADQWKLILGGRLDWYDYDNYRNNSDYEVVRNVTRYAGLIYDLNDHHSLYASFTDIFSPQSSIGRDGNVIRPIDGENYEFGLKSEYLNGALNTSIAVFQVNQNNRSRAVRDVSQCTVGTSCAEASGEVRSRGVDMEIQGALQPNWQVGAGYTYTNTEYIKDDSYDKGDRFNTLSPEHMFKLTTVYRLLGDWSNWRVGANVYRQSRIYMTASEAGTTDDVEQKAYTLVDMIVGYKASKNLDLQLNINNLLDKTYYRGVSSANWAWESYGEPRSARITAKYTF
ncbi:TonB-dependent receptor [Methylophilus sp. OH31]|uniref:TonB-dependent siderophore receptor n=1 Tax=Methylophilus sp. OH31 TaxID=1387312 RepID=UPI000466197D|nr:TonB-dependent receptor [Methylophilus sp. OH31]